MIRHEITETDRFYGIHSGDKVGAGAEELFELLDAFPEIRHEFSDHFLRELADYVSFERFPRHGRKVFAHDRFKMGQKSAATRGWSWDLTFDEYDEIWREPCVYCGTRDKGGGVCLDRVDNFQGYTRANVVPCCGACNTKKGVKTVDDFLGEREEYSCQR